MNLRIIEILKPTVLLLSLLLLPSLLQSQESCCCGADEEIDVPGGDFEFGPYPPPGGWINYGGGFGPWDVTTGTISHHDDGHNNLGAGNPNPSTAHLDLNGASQGAVCQNISGFTEGQECTLTFFYAIHSALSSAEATVELDGGDALSVTWDADNTGNVIWLEANYSFIATDSNMELCFISETSVGCCGMLLDDISFSCCPSDQEDPVLDPLPADISIMCLDDLPDEDVVEASDDCTENIELEFEEDIEEMGCEYIIYRNWSVMDDCGNISEHQQVITVLDEEAPVIINPPSDLEVYCDEDVEELFEDWIENLGFADVEENCNEIILDLDYDEIPFDACGQTRVTFIYSDLCGNFVEEDAFFEIEDRSDPTFTSLPQDLLVACDSASVQSIDNWLESIGNATATDDCGYTATHNFNGDYTADQEVSFTIIDQCGNATEASAWIYQSILIDTIRIDTFTCLPDEAGIEEIFIDASDGCDSLIIINTLLLASDTVELFDYTCDASIAGIDSILSVNAAGCDSLTIINRFALSADTTYNYFSSCDPTLVGTDSLFLLNADGCDSLIINQTELLSDTSIVIYDSSCDPAQVGMDTLVLVGSNGCDSTVYINTSLSPNDTIWLTEFSCMIDAATLDTALITGVLCDTIQITEWIPLQNDTTYLMASDCHLELTEYVTEVFAGSECDSIVITEIQALPSDTVILNEFSCRLIEVGRDSMIFSNSVGCDSLVITVTEYDAIDAVMRDSLHCDSNLSGQDTLYISGMHCDSTIIINYILLPSDETTIQRSVCHIQESDTLLLMNMSGCDSTVIIEYVPSDIIYDIEYSYDPCDANAPVTLEFANISGGSPAYSFIVDGQVYSESIIETVLMEGNHTVNVLDAEACEADAVILDIAYFEGFEIDMPDTLILPLNTDVAIPVNINPIAEAYMWSPSEGLSCSDCPNPVVDYDSDIEEYSLMVSSMENCQESALVTIIRREAEEVSVFFPNVFNPGSGGSNDRWAPLHGGSVDRFIHLRIYDRWGNKLYEALDAPADGNVYWDGYYNNQRVQPGVFLYDVAWSLNNGKEERLLGQLTVLR